MSEDFIKKIYLHGEGIKSIKNIDITNVVSIDQLLEKFEKESDTNFDNSDKGIEIFLDSVGKKSASEELLEKISDKDHIHCHRCKKVKSIIVYNGDRYEIESPPNEKLHVILQKALTHFNISKNDGADMVLRYHDAKGNILQDNDRIGSFTDYPKCEATLSLTSKRNVQG